MARIGRTMMITAAALLVASCGGLGGPRLRPLPATPTKPVAQQPLGPLSSDPAQTAAGQEAENAENKVADLEDDANKTTDDAATAAGLAGDTAQNSGNQVAALGTPPADADGGAKIGRADLLGGWKIASGGEQCQLFMNLTSWKGGYRASTRGCNSPALKNISAWDLNGKQVTLKDGNGAAIGSVFPTNSGRFSGQTAGGRQLAFFR